MHARATLRRNGTLCGGASTTRLIPARTAKTAQPGEDGEDGGDDGDDGVDGGVAVPADAALSGDTCKTTFAVKSRRK